MKKINLIFIFIFIFIFCKGFAQNPDIRWAKGTIADFVTLSPVEGFTSIQLIRCDTVVSEGYTTMIKIPGKSKAQFMLPVIAGDFIICIDNENYQQYKDSIHVVVRKREKEIELGRILLKRRMTEKAIDLAEVEVKASKIKFYFDKDTLVYNADAFTTQKGFVLTDILNKMPGIEIKPNGEILSNGKKINDLLVNGKNFFNRDRKTILENLPAFSVKNVKVYEKTLDSSAVIKRDREIEGLVMDIQLKKEYAKSTFTNGVAAYGTDHRYYEKLFGMKFHSLYRFSAYANTNNINYNEIFSNDGTGKNTDDGAGEKNTSIAGFCYDIDNSQGKYSLEGNAKISYTDVCDSRANNEILYFTSGDIYKNSLMARNNYMTKLTTDHNIYLLGNSKNDFTIKPTLKYSHIKGNGFENDSTENINNIITNSLNERQALEGNLTIDKVLHATHSGDFLQTSITAYFANNFSRSFNNYHLRNDKFLLNCNEWKNQYTDYDFNQRQWHVYGLYHYALGAYTGLEVSYTYDKIQTNRDNEFYQLDKLAEWNEEMELGRLPSPERLAEVIDGANSYWTDEYESNHQASFSYKFRRMDTNSNATEVYIGFPLKLYNKSLHYKNLLTDTIVAKNNLLPSFTLNAARGIRRKKHSFYFIRLTYSFQQSMPNMRNFINVRNDATPLFITEGNPHLKNSNRNSIEGCLQLQPHSFGNHSIVLNYNKISNEISQSLFYDKSSGISTLKPININGNDNWHFMTTNSFYTGKGYSTMLKNSLSCDFSKSARMTGTDDDGGLKKNRIRYHEISDEMEISSKMLNGKLGIIIKPYYTFAHASSKNNCFNPFSTHDFGCKLNLDIELPADIRLKSDFRSIFRKGYKIKDLNQDEQLWNMSLSKAFSHIILSVTANDILNDRQNIYKYVNAEKRLEQTYNHMGRYLLFSFGWNFDKKKK